MYKELGLKYRHQHADPAFLKELNRQLAIDHLTGRRAGILNMLYWEKAKSAAISPTATARAPAKTMVVDTPSLTVHATSPTVASPVAHASTPPPPTPTTLTPTPIAGDVKTAEPPALHRGQKRRIEDMLRDFLAANDAKAKDLSQQRELLDQLKREKRRRIELESELARVTMEISNLAN